jgi:hypothetical protein
LLPQHFELRLLRLNIGFGDLRRVLLSLIVQFAVWLPSPPRQGRTCARW